MWIYLLNHLKTVKVRFKIHKPKTPVFTTEILEEQDGLPGVSVKDEDQDNSEYEGAQEAKTFTPQDLGGK